MALDGITVSNSVYELSSLLKGGRMDKIYQPQKDEIVISVRNNSQVYKLLLSANPSHPRLHITNIQRDNPATAPMFCMVLRKHIAGSRIINISQFDLERIAKIQLEAMNEMGDMVERSLIIEIMGKHSNIILVDENGKILDSIKHITHETSSVREVLPGKAYTLPPSQNKLNPLELNYEIFKNNFYNNEGVKVQQFIYKNYTGISPAAANEIAFDAGINGDDYTAQISEEGLKKLFDSFNNIMNSVKSGSFAPEIILDSNSNKVIEFFPFESKQFTGFVKKKYNSIQKT